MRQVTRVVIGAYMALITGMVLADSTDGPTLQEAAAAFKQFVASMNDSGTVPEATVKVLHGCYPPAGRHVDELLCVLEATPKRGESAVQVVAFRRHSGQWTIVDQDQSVEVACPTRSEATAQIQRHLRDSSVRITELPTEGTLTEDRVQFEGFKGLWRLMCTLQIASDRTGLSTLITYFRYENGHYQIEADSGLVGVDRTLRR